MSIKTIIKLSLIGGFAGSLESLIGYTLSFVLPKRPLLIDFLLGGALFVIVGAAIAYSLIKSIPELRPKNNKIILGGIAGGFLAGLFFHFGIGLYIGIFIYSIVICFTFVMLKMPHIALRIVIGGIVGGLGGTFMAALYSAIWFSSIKLAPFLQDQISVINMVIMNSIIIYCINFGMLISVRKKQELSPD